MSQPHAKCPLCTSDRISAKEGYSADHLYTCHSCSFIFSNLIPSDSELTQLYSNEHVRANYFSPITVSRYEALLNRFDSFRSTNRILDIGSGQGYFTSIAKHENWDVYGVELSEQCVEKGNKMGINMHLGTLESAAFPDNYFDVVVGIEVIEHLSFPDQFINEVHRITRPGGCIYITTPNFNSLLRYRLGANYDVIDYPLHLCYFTKKTLKSAFSQRGFHVSKISTTGYSFTRSKTSKGKSNQDYVAETSDDEMLRFKLEHNAFLRFLKRIANGILNLLSIGDSLKGEFIKIESN